MSREYLAAQARVLAVLKTKPMTAQLIALHTASSVSNTQTAIRLLRDKKEIFIVGWLLAIKGGSHTPVYAHGRREDASRPVALTYAQRRARSNQRHGVIARRKP